MTQTQTPGPPNALRADFACRGRVARNRAASAGNPGEPQAFICRVLRIRRPGSFPGRAGLALGREPSRLGQTLTIDDQAASACDSISASACANAAARASRTDPLPFRFHSIVTTPPGTLNRRGR